MSDNGIAKFVDLIRDMIKSELGKTDSTAVCKVVEKRREGAYDYVYDLYVEPDESNIIRGVQNASNSDINEGDYVYIYKINNQLNNCFILKKIGKIGASAYVSILEDKISTLVTKDDFSTSITQTAEEINLKASRSDVESEISQTAEKITAQVVKKHDANGTEQTKTFGWDLTVEQGFIIYDVINGNRTDVVKADSTGLEINGKVTATSGYIGNGIAGFTIGSTAIFNGINSFYDSTHNGIYLGVDGIRLGPNFYVDNQGNVVAKTLKTIDRVEIKYNKTLTNLPIPTTGWVSTIQELGDVAGYYVWTRTTTYYTTYTSGVQDSDVKYSISRDGVSTLIKGTVVNWTALGSIVNPQDGDGYIVTDASDDPNIGTKESEGILYTYSSTATPHWVYCGQVKGPKGDKGDSPYLVDIENDFDSIPCDSDLNVYDGYDWVGQTTHKIRVYYGTTLITNIPIYASVSSLPATGNGIVYTVTNVPRTPTDCYHITAGGNYTTAWITGIGTDKSANIEYSFYQNKILMATGKFEATKQITGADATDYSLSWSSSSFKKDPNTGAITPSSIRVDVKETKKGTTPVLNPTYCHYKYKFDNASTWTTPSTETFPANISSTLISGHSSVTIGVWVDLTKTGSGTYTFWESESINVMEDGVNGTSPYVVDIENDFDSIPCDNDLNVYEGYAWQAQTTHKIRIYYGSTIVTNVPIYNSVSLLPASGKGIVYTVANVPRTPTDCYHITAGQNYVTAWISGIGSDKSANIEYDFYENRILMATGKFEATKQITGADATDYSLTWSASSFKKDPNDDSMTPGSITVNVKETQKGKTPVTNPSYCHYKYKYDNASSWTTPATETFPVTIQASHMANHNSITIGVWVDLTKTGSGTYTFWESESINVMVDGENGTSPYIIDIENDFDSVPCDNNKIPHTGYAWEAQTTHYIRPFYGSTQITDFTVQASGGTLPTSGYTVTYTAINVPNGKYFITKGSSDLYATAHIEGIDATADGASVEYNLYQGSVLMANAKFEATKQVTGATAIDYELFWDNSSFHKNPNDSSITPSSISINARKIVGSVVTETSTSVPTLDSCQWRIKYDSGEWSALSSTFPCVISSTNMTGKQKAIVELQRNSVKWDTETIEVIVDGTNGQPGSPGDPGDPGESTCTIILDNPNDSIPCTSAGTPTYTPAEWKSETQHTLKAFYGTEQKNFLVVKNSVPSGRTTGSYTIVYKLAGLGDESLFNLNGYVAGTEVSSWSPYLTGVTNKTTTVNYKLYNGQQEVASNKFWATKQIPGEDGAPAVDYKLTTSDGVTFKETGSGTTSVITPSSITINSQKSVDGTVTINPSETYYTTQYEGGSESAKVQFTSSGLVINNSDLATYNYVVIKLYVYNSTSSTYSYWESITLNKLKNGADGLGSYTMDLSNDFESVPCTSGGIILTNPYVAKTTPRIYYGNEEETGWTITPTVPTGITINPTTGTSGTEFTMNLTSFVAGTTGSDVVFTATATNKPTLAKTFVFSQLRGGEPGTRYYLECPIGTIGKNKSGAYTISSFTIVAKKATGDSLGTKIDNAVFKIKQDTDSALTVLTAQGEATITLDNTGTKAEGHFNPTSKLYIETYLPGGTVLMDKEEIPVVIDGTDGQPGSPGNPGSNTAVVFLYQRSSTAPTQKPNGNLTYTFATGKLSGSESTFQGWKQTIPTDTRFPCYKIQASAISTEATDTIASSEWSEIELFLKDGENGDPGYNTAQVYLYKRSATVATIDWTETLTYTFSTHSLNKTPSNWYTSIPSGTDPIYMTAAVANSRTDTDDIDYNEWAEPIKMAQNGENGSPGSPAVAYSVSMPSSIGRSANNGYNPSSFTAILYKTVGSAAPVQQVAYWSLFIDGAEETSARVDQRSTITVTLATYQPTQSVKIVAYSESARTTIIASSEASVNTVVTFDNVCEALNIPEDQSIASSQSGLYYDENKSYLLINATAIKTGIIQVGDASSGGIRFLANKDMDVVSIGGFDVSSNKLSIGAEGSDNSIVLKSYETGYLCYKSTNPIQTYYLSMSTMKISDNRSGSITQSKRFSIYVRAQLNSSNTIKVSNLNPSQGSSGTGSKSNWFSTATNVKQTIAGIPSTSFDLSNYTKIDYEFGTSGNDYIYIAFLKSSGEVEDSLGFVLVPGDNELLVSELEVSSNGYYGFARCPEGDISTSGAHISVGQHFYVDASGALTSSSGNIGGWTIASDSLSKGTFGQANSAWLVPGGKSGTSIGGSGDTVSFAITAGSNFGVSTNGALYCTFGSIGGFQISANTLTHNGTSGTGLIMNGAQQTSITDGKLRAANAVITGNGTIETSSLSFYGYEGSMQGVEINGEVYDYVFGYSSSTTSAGTVNVTPYLFCRQRSTGATVANPVATEIVLKITIIGYTATGPATTLTDTRTLTFPQGQQYQLLVHTQTLFTRLESVSGEVTPPAVYTGDTAFAVSRHFVPYSASTYSLGSSNRTWTNVYADTSQITTSDRNQKMDIQKNLNKYSNFFDKLQPASFKYITNTSNRTHLGLISQEVEEALTESGLTSLDFAGFIKSPKDETKPEEERTDEDYTYGIRYGELHAMEIYEIQQLKAKIQKLEQQLKEAKGE